MADSTIPASTLDYPPLHEGRPFVVLSDWDGTITTQDSNDYLTDNLGYGKDKRRAGNLDVLNGRPFRDAFREMLQSISANGRTFDDCKEALLQNIHLDPGFPDFYEWCRKQDIPFVIVSSGMAPLIRAVLSKYLETGATNIDIIANDVEGDQASAEWNIKFRHPTSTFGHDKSLAILPYKRLQPAPLLFFFGDGVSDLSAAQHADVLFVKRKGDGENDLQAYCIRENIQHIVFHDFSEALVTVQAIVNGVNAGGSVKEVVGKFLEKH
ncbi:HAD-like domain-containing protein [Roridomyces roridus]|uniref:HAD-like domain-containing protein n=1 Tax=Roridomyces roridus TaxID=1738132 RepID=A0AAD7B7N4_9AGAR|nr:HAD-like domain-containing protein [Roridomyces roridus]